MQGVLNLLPFYLHEVFLIWELKVHLSYMKKKLARGIFFSQVL